MKLYIITMKDYDGGNLGIVEDKCFKSFKDAVYHMLKTCDWVKGQDPENRRIEVLFIDEELTWGAARVLDSMDNVIYIYDIETMTCEG